MQESHQSQDSKEREEKIKLYNDLSDYYDKLGSAVGSDAGQVILTEINSILNDVNISINQIVSKPLIEPYEFTEEELNKVKLLHCKRDQVERLVNWLKVDQLQNMSKKYREDMLALQQGEPLHPTY